MGAIHINYAVLATFGAQDEGIVFDVYDIDDFWVQGQSDIFDVSWVFDVDCMQSIWLGQVGSNDPVFTSLDVVLTSFDHTFRNDLMVVENIHFGTVFFHPADWNRSS